MSIDKTQGTLQNDRKPRFGLIKRVLHYNQTTKAPRYLRFVF